MPEIISPEVECLKLKAAINENWRLAQKAAGDAVERAILTGELLGKWKELLPHGKFEVFVEKHFEGSLRTARLYMQAAKGLKSLPKRQSNTVLLTEDSLAGLIGRLKKGDKISAKGKPGGVTASLATEPASDGPASDEAADSSGEDASTEAQGRTPQETGSRPPRSGTDKPGTTDYGKCPNCAGVRWDVDEFGASCAKCHHPHGEPAEDKDEGEDRAGILRSKSVKTCEALMRCFGDLHLLCPKAGSYKQSIDLCKTLLKTAQGWK